MICKWCGATVDVTKGKCSSCGKEIPPLSDCGGFYDVAPKAARISPTAPASDPAPQPVPVIPLQPAANAPVPNLSNPPAPKQNAPGKKTGSRLIVAALALLVVAVAACLILSIELNQRLSALEKDIREDGSSIEEMQSRSNELISRLDGLETGTTEPTEAPTETEPSTEADAPTPEQFITFCIRSEYGEITMEESSLEDAELNEETLSQNGEQLLTLKLDRAGKKFVFSANVKEALFGRYENGFFLWQYRSPETGEWISLKNEEIQPEGRSGEVYSELAISKVPDGSPEIRCTLIRKSEECGILWIEYTLAAE